MTRENKLGLIIGFGLVLFIGVLISDHLSEASRQVTADLAMAIDPLVDEDDVPLVEFGPIAATNHVVDEPTISDTSIRLHVVSEGDTLRTIARTWYGDESIASTLAAHNNLPDPNQLVTGTRLIMPEFAPNPTASVAVTMGETLHAAAPSPSAPVVDALDVYTVQPGDTLSQIAQKLLGSSRNTDKLFEMNRDVIGNIDALQVGMKLRYHRPSS